MSDSGLLVFGQSGGPTSKDNAYDSRKPRLQVSLVDVPPKLAIIDDFSGGTALSVSTTGVKLREVLATIPLNNLSYTPEVLMYLYTKSYAGSTTDTRAGQYGGGVFYYSGSSGTVEDKIFFEVDSKEVRIVHTLEEFFAFSYTSPAPNYLFRVKYYILSNDSHMVAYDYSGNPL